MIWLVALAQDHSTLRAMLPSMTTDKWRCPLAHASLESWMLTWIVRTSSPSVCKRSASDAQAPLLAGVAACCAGCWQLAASSTSPSQISTDALMCTARCYATLSKTSFVAHRRLQWLQVVPTAA